MIILLIVAFLSLLTFILYCIDKGRAKRGAWRIPERVLLGFSLLGGGLGGSLAMMLVRHKTKHWYFAVANVIGVIIDLLLVATVFLV